MRGRRVQEYVFQVLYFSMSVSKNDYEELFLHVAMARIIYYYYFKMCTAATMN